MRFDPNPNGQDAAPESRRAGAWASSMTLPIRPRFTTSLDAAQRQRIETRAHRLVCSDPAISPTIDFAGGVAPGIAPGGGLFYEDHSSVGLAIPGEEARYEYRMRALAGTSDLLLLGSGPHGGFDAYCREVVGIGAPLVLQAPPAPTRRIVPLSTRCREDARFFARLVQFARDAGGLTVHPYTCSGHDWLLGSALASAARVPVCVAGPPPGVARRVNDKGWFAEQVSWLLGRESVPPTFTVLGPAALAGRIAHLAHHYPRTVIKIPDSAGGKGNLVLDSSDLNRLSLKTIHRRLRRLLGALGWRGTFPLVAGVWETPVVASPSAQLWLPERNAGSPVVEGLFVQMLTGTEGEFIGAEPSRLPPVVEQRMVDEAVRIGSLFQALGYFGRCSLDAVLVGDRAETAELHWIECNGRWGGVSIPLTLANRFATAATPEIVVVQQVGIDLPACTFEQALQRTAPHLYRDGRNTRGVVFMSPRLLESGSGMHFVAIAETLEAARDEALAVRQLLAGQR